MKHKSDTVKLFGSSISQNLRFSYVLKHKSHTVKMCWLFDLHKPKVFKGFETQKQYSLAFGLFGLPKPKVFIGFEIMWFVIG